MGFGLFVIGISILLLAFLIYKELGRNNRRWLAWRIAANIIMCACFVFLVLPLSFETSLQTKKNVLHLITPGVSADSLAHIQGKLYYTDPSLKDKLKQKADFIPDLSYYLTGHPAIQNLKVYGYGLATDELKKLKNHKIEFHPAAKPDGIIECNWNEKLREEEIFTVQGVYHNSFAKPVQLKLTGFGTTLDSVSLPAQQLSSFNLKHPIRQKGKVLLELVALNGNDTLAKESLPVQTTNKAPLNLLMLTSFPSFEYNFLKKWLYENQYPLAVRNQISKNKYSIDFLNRSSFKINSIQSNILEKEDVLIIDQQELESISPTEKRAIEQAVTKGLGVIIWAEQPGANAALMNRFKLTNLQVQDKLTSLFVRDHEMDLAPLPSNQQLYISPSSRQQAVIISKQQHVVAAEELFGNGKLMATTLQTSYQWLLSGHQQDYARYWSELIRSAARKQEPDLTLQTNNSIPVVQHKLVFDIATAETGIPLVQYGSKRLAVQQNLLFPNSWQAQTWPLTKGWHSINVNRHDFNFFVYGKADWQSLRQYKLLQQNSYFTHNQKIDRSGEETRVILKNEVSKWWFLIGFVLAIGFLWFENKLNR